MGGLNGGIEVQILYEMQNAVLIRDTKMTRLMNSSDVIAGAAVFWLLSDPRRALAPHLSEGNVVVFQGPQYSKCFEE